MIRRERRDGGKARGNKEREKREGLRKGAERKIEKWSRSRERIEIERKEKETKGN